MAQVGRLQRVPEVDVVIVAAAQHIAATERDGTGREAAGAGPLVLRNLLIGSNVEKARRLILAAGRKSVAARMILRPIRWGETER